MKPIQVIINESHNLLPQQEELLNTTFGSEWERYDIPAEGLNRDQQDELLDEFDNSEGLKEIVFVSPIPRLIKHAVARAHNIDVMCNDNREAKELPNGKIIHVVAKDGWYLD